MKYKNLLCTLSLLILVAYVFTINQAFNKYPLTSDPQTSTLEISPDQNQINLSGFRLAYDVTVKMVSIITNLTSGEE